MSKIGYNVHSKDDAFLSHAQRLKPRVMFFMNDWGGAAEFQKQFPACYVVHRVSAGEEADMHLTPGRTLAHLQERARERQDNRVYINLFTEPDVNDDTNLQKLATECLGAARWAKANHVRVALPHLAHYRLTTDHWRTYLEPLVNEIANSPIDPTDGKPLLLLCLDSYGGGHMFSGVVDRTLPGTNETAHIAPENWKASPTNEYFHVGREVPYMLDRLSRGLALPFWFLSEFGLDRTDDIGAWLDTLKRDPRYDKAQAWKTLIPQFEEWYGQNTPHKLSPAHAYAKMMVAVINAVYRQFARHFIGACIYAYGTNNDARWFPFRVDAWLDIMNELETAQAGESAVTNVPEPTTPTNKGLPTAVTVKASPSFNVRSSQSTASTANIVGQLTNGQTVNWYKDTRTPAKVGGYFWSWIEAGALKGWTAMVWPTWEQQYAEVVTPPPDPEPEPEPEPLPIPPIHQFPPLPEFLAGDKNERVKTAAFLRWIADVIEHYPGAEVQLASVPVEAEAVSVKGTRMKNSTIAGCVVSLVMVILMFSAVVLPADPFVSENPTLPHLAMTNTPRPTLTPTEAPAEIVQAGYAFVELETVSQGAMNVMIDLSWLIPFAWIANRIVEALKQMYLARTKQESAPTWLVLLTSMVIGVGIALGVQLNMLAGNSTLVVSQTVGVILTGLVIGGASNVVHSLAEIAALLKDARRPVTVEKASVTVLREASGRVDEAA